MAVQAPPALTDAPLSPDRTDRPTFTARSIALDNWRKNIHIPEVRAALANVAANATDAATSATAADGSKTAAAASAASASASQIAAAASAGATLWVSGTTYALGVRVLSPADGLLYRRIVAGAGAIDPSTDNTNWAPANLPASGSTIYLANNFGAL